MLRSDKLTASFSSAAAADAPSRGAPKAFAREQFGRPGGALTALATPVPIAGLALWVAATWLMPSSVWPWLTDRLAEIAWMSLVPFVLVVIGQQLARALSKTLYRRTQGQRFIDFSGRAWHYHLAVALAAAPLVALQLSPEFLDAYLGWRVRLGTFFGPGVVGYDPDLSNLLVLGVLPIVFWQVGRILASLPNGRLTLFQLEVSRLSRTVSWQRDAFAEAVTEAFDRWFADLMPVGPASRRSGEAQRRCRLRWGAFRREVVASFATTPPDLERANLALRIFRTTR